jgi:NitT/TauT family transport system substrate-binding protein
MKKKKTIMAVLGLILLVRIFSACSEKQSSSTASTGGQEAGPQKIRVGMMAHYLSVPLQVIQDEKLDEKYGFTMELISFPSGGPMAEALGAGKWDIGPIGAGGMVAVPTYNAKLIADVEYQMDGAWIMARPDSDIVKAGANLKTLPEVIGNAQTVKGKQMLGTFGNISHYMGLNYISQFGLEIKDINFIHMETSQVYTSFIAGNGDIACMGSTAAALKLKEAGYPVIGGLKQQGRSQQDAILVSDDFYTNKYDTCVNFMKAWLTATGKLNSDIEYEIEMTKRFFKASGRSDYTDDSVRQECEMCSYIDTSNAFEKETGKWMTDLVAFMVETGSMEKNVLDAMKVNVRTDIFKEAVAQLTK